LLQFDISGLIPISLKLQPQVTITSLDRFYISVFCTNSCALRSVCFCWQVETSSFVCSRRNRKSRGWKWVINLSVYLRWL